MRGGRGLRARIEEADLKFPRCARAVSGGHTAATPPSNVMNSRRFH
jgi:hypothetical protein